MYITYEFNNWWKYHFAIFTWKISQHFESLWSPSSLVNCYISLEMPVSSQGHYVFTVFRLLTDFVCLYTYEFWLCLWKIVRSLIILLLPLQNICITDDHGSIHFVINTFPPFYPVIHLYTILRCWPLLAYLYFSFCIFCIFWFRLTAFAYFVGIFKPFVDKPTTERKLLNN